MEEYGSGEGRGREGIAVPIRCGPPDLDRHRESVLEGPNDAETGYEGVGAHRQVHPTDLESACGWSRRSHRREIDEGVVPVQRPVRGSGASGCGPCVVEVQRREHLVSMLS